MMASTLSHKHEQVVLHRLRWVGPLVIVSTIIATSLLRVLAVAFLGVPETFQYLQFSSVIGSTIFFVLLALLAFALVCRFARRPVQFYCVLALVALCLSLLTPIMALVGPLHIPGMNLSVFWAMIAMHIVTATIVVSLLTMLTRERRDLEQKG